MVLWCALYALGLFAFCMNRLPEKSWLSSIVVIFFLILVALAVEPFMFNNSQTNIRSIIGESITIWFIVCCGYCAKVTWGDFFGKNAIRKNNKKIQSTI